MARLLTRLTFVLAAMACAGAASAATIRMTPPQLLAAAERAVLAQRYDEARVMLAALGEAPGYAMERHFLLGYMAAQTGDLKIAQREFRAVLRDRPEMTRARLELARVLMLDGKEAAADHHFRLAEQDAELPPEIEKTIRQARGLIRSRRNWTFNFDFGLVPDSNINNATDARTIDFGQTQIPLNDDARRKSGLGQMVGANGSVRFGMSKRLSLLVEGSGDFTNHKGGDADDISILGAVGPEFTIGKEGRLSLQALGFSHWYGGKVAQDGVGARINYQQNLDQGQRVGLQVDVRRVNSDFSPAYDGTNLAAYLTYERVVRRSMVASVTLLGRRDDLKASVYSNKELGFNLGIGGELPLGINAGLSAGLSRARYDDPLVFPFGPEPRKDWRMNARAYLGARSIRVLGFSPSITYNFSRVASNISFYDSERHRVQFALARYF